MLKGTIPRKKLLQIKEASSQMKEKMYLSLFTFINYEGAEETPKIEIQKAPREILKAIFPDDETVNSVIIRRQELANSCKKEDKNKKIEAATTFKNEFLSKLRAGIDEKILNFKISCSKKNEYD